MKHGVYFDFDGFYFRWIIYENGVEISRCNLSYDTLDKAEQNIRAMCQTLYPHTIEAMTVTEAIREFKKKQ